MHRVRWIHIHLPSATTRTKLCPKEDSICKKKGLVLIMMCVCVCVCMCVCMCVCKRQREREREREVYAHSLSHCACLCVCHKASNIPAVRTMKHTATMPSLWQAWIMLMLFPLCTDLTFGTRGQANQKGQRRSHDQTSHHMTSHFMHTSALSSTSSQNTASGSSTWLGVASDDGRGSPSICTRKNE